MSIDIQTLKESYKSAGQDHVFTFWDSLSSLQQNDLVSQLKALDPPDEISRIAKETIETFEREIKSSSSSPSSQSQSSQSKETPPVIEPLPESATSSLLLNDSQSVAQQSKWYDLGLQIIKDNKLAVILLAGGQGTRLGSSAPKGCYDVNLPSHKSLFQLQAERISRLQTLASSSSSSAVIIPWYIMTSGPTRKPTEEFFEKNKYFGLDKSNVIFFEQGVLPCLTTDGKIILETPSKVAVAPDGNGGIYKALVKGGILDDLKKRGIEHIHTYCVDNCLVKVADPVFVGWAAERQVDIGTKVVRKRNATESVGLIVSKNGAPAVIEYSEISKELASQPDPSNPEILRFRAANIVNHYYSAKYLLTIPDWPSSNLPYHVAHKKIPYVDLTTGIIDPKPTKPNGIKLEQFVFDVFPSLKLTSSGTNNSHGAQFAMMEVKRENEFSPLKNAPGSKEDSPETSRLDLLTQSKQWLIDAGAQFPNPETVIEVSPLTSYAGEGLEKFKGKVFDEVVEYNI